MACEHVEAWYDMFLSGNITELLENSPPSEATAVGATFNDSLGHHTYANFPEFFADFGGRYAPILGAGDFQFRPYSYIGTDDTCYVKSHVHFVTSGIDTEFLHEVKVNEAGHIVQWQGFDDGIAWGKSLAAMPASS